MAHWAKDVTKLIGRTPIVELKRVSSGLDATVLAKLEMFSPGCSIKDRVAWQMICEAESQGSLRPGGIITEPTSGNMGISLAWMAAARGYQCILTMPDTISSLTRGVPSSSRNNGMIGPNVRSAMLTKKRINTVVKYSGRFQKGAVDGDEAFSSAERS